MATPRVATIPEVTKPMDRGGRGREATSPPPRIAGSRTDAPPRVGDDTLDNGVRVLSEHVPGVRSVSVGVWVRHGSAHEPAARMGESHMLEHMVFKGTERRSAHDIALSLEALGGSLDAFTSREHTAFQARVLDSHLPEALDVLADMVRRPLLRDDDLDLEREVVLEEIAQVDDTPDDLVFELHGEGLWQGHPYGHAILGTRETVGGLTGDDLRALHGTRYRGRNLVVAATGNVDHDHLLAQVSEAFGDLDAGEAPTPTADPSSTRSGRRWVERDSHQLHLLVGREGVSHGHPLRIPLILVSQAFGGGMSSRLFQRIREELGLAYTVFSYQSFYSRSGLVGVYLGTRPGSGERAEAALRHEFARIARDGLGADELEQTRMQVKGQIMLSLESTSARLYRLAGSALNGEPWLGLDDLLARVDAVTPDQVAEAARLAFDPDTQYTLLLGPG